MDFRNFDHKGIMGGSRDSQTLLNGLVQGLVSITIKTAFRDGIQGGYTSLSLVRNYNSGDVNNYYHVNLLDVAEIDSNWLDCSVLFDPGCVP